MTKINNFISFINKNKIQFINLCFTDFKGKEQNLTIPKNQVNYDLFKYGRIFDGSSVNGWKDIHESDMILIPDPVSFSIDPFCKNSTVIIRCDVFEPNNLKNYNRDPRSIAKRAEEYLCNSGIADKVMFGPELEFFLFDDIRFKTSLSGCNVIIDDQESSWNNDKIYLKGNKGHRPRIKGGYASVPPIDSSHNLRSFMSNMMEKMGLIIESHHHEVAASGQNEITFKFNSLTKKADETQIYKYVVRNIANDFGKTATFMPKPIMCDNGSGMHCNISLWKDNVNLFAGNLQNNLSEIALFFIGGILKHAKALNAITNPTTNSYKRLVPGYEAPIMLTYSISNRSSAIRIPIINFSKNNDTIKLSTNFRIEVRFPDPSANPYLAFSALLMAGLDGIINETHPGAPIDKNLYTLSKKEKIDLPYMSRSFDEALSSLNEDCCFLMQGNVFTKDCIDAYIALCQEESQLIHAVPHPMEFELYYSV